MGGFLTQATWGVRLAKDKFIVDRIGALKAVPLSASAAQGREVAMKIQDAIKALNHALGCEYAGVIQYLQSAQLVQGHERELHESFFKSLSKECWKHAAKVGRWLVVLNSVPSVEPAAVRQSTDLTEMFRQGLELEREAEKAYLDALAAAGEDAALRFFVEEMVHDERLHIDDLERLLGMKKLAAPTREVRAKA